MTTTAGTTPRPALRPLILVMALFAVGCSGLPTPVRVIATPFTLVRDVVDVPLVSLTNVFQSWADKSDPVPRAGAGLTLGRRGIRPGIFIGFGFYLWTSLSWVIGGADWVLCRSIWPGWPGGDSSPWLARGDDWGSLYFPSTRALWSDEVPGPTEAPGG
jgi:hypothetical protein